MHSNKWTRRAVLAAIGGGLAVLPAWAACPIDAGPPVDSKPQGDDMSTSAARNTDPNDPPRLDLRQPGRLETATFALG